MEISVVDPFTRPDASSKGGSRAAEPAGSSFSDVLDASSRQAETQARGHEHGERAKATHAETASKHADDAAPAKAEHAKPKSETNASPAKPKSEAATAPSETETVEEPVEDASPEAAAGDTTAQAPATGARQEQPAGKGAAALEWLANLLGGDTQIDATQPKGQMVAGIVVPQNVPDHAAAAANHNSTGLVPSTGTPADGVPAPAAGAPAMPAPTGPTGQSSPTGENASAPAPAAQNPATPAAAVPAAEIPTGGQQTAATGAAQPAPVNAPQTPANATAPAADSSTTATLPVDALVADLVEPEAPVDGSDPVVPMSTTTGSTPTARSATAPTTVSGYAAQIASQDANAEAADVPAAAVDPEFVAAVNSDADGALPDVTTSADDVAMSLKPADGMAMASSETSATRDAQAIDAATTRGSRPPAMPVAEQVVVRIAKAMADGVDRINVKLSPAELGHIDVRMEIGPDGKFQAVFAADRPQTLELLQRDARELARALQDAGLRADTGSLSFNLRGQGQQGQADGGPAHMGSGPLLAGADELPSELPPPAAYRSTGAPAGRVDIRV